MSSCLPETESHRGAEGAAGVWKSPAEEPGDLIHSSSLTHYELINYSDNQLIINKDDQLNMRCLFSSAGEDAEGGAAAGGAAGAADLTVEAGATGPAPSPKHAGV